MIALTCEPKARGLMTRTPPNIIVDEWGVLGGRATAARSDIGLFAAFYVLGTLVKGTVRGKRNNALGGKVPVLIEERNKSKVGRPMFPNRGIYQ